MEELVVVKYGSSCISRKNISSFAKQIARLRSKGKKVMIVSSGSVRLGKELSSELLTNPDEVSLRAWAALGSAQIVELWRRALFKYGIAAAQILVTHADLDDSSFLKASLEDLLSLGVVAIVNENDVLSDTELVRLRTGGDNDGLAAHIASRIGAQKLILISHGVEGYISEGIIKNEVKLALVSKKDHFAGSGHGTGGIESKLTAAQVALEEGVERVFYAGVKSKLVDVIEKRSGTEFYV